MLPKVPNIIFFFFNKNGPKQKYYWLSLVCTGATLNSSWLTISSHSSISLNCSFSNVLVQNNNLVKSLYIVCPCDPAPLGASSGRSRTGGSSAKSPMRITEIPQNCTSRFLMHDIAIYRPVLPKLRDFSSTIRYRTSFILCCSIARVCPLQL